jgi:hypothetical protein
MNTPKTTKFTLKRIIENLGTIPSKGAMEETPKLSVEEKRRLQEMASTFEQYGEALANEEAIKESAKYLTELSQLAETYALNECGDWFQQEIVQKDMKDLRRRVTEYNKLANECYARMQQAGVAYQDIGHIMSRYFNVNKNPGTSQQYTPPEGTKQPLQMDEKTESPLTTTPPTPISGGAPLKKKVNEDLDIQCAWCKKMMGKKIGTQTGVSHTICPECRAKMEKDIPPKPSQKPNIP